MGFGAGVELVSRTIGLEAAGEMDLGIGIVGMV